MRSRNALLYILITTLVFSCQKKLDNSQWDEVIVSPMISRNSVFQRLDKETEIEFSFEKADSSSKRTSDVAFYYGKIQDGIDNQYSKFNNCRVYIQDSTGLVINIGFNDLFGGSGFQIRYKKQKFYTEGYHFTDIPIEGEDEIIQNVIYQKLKLDKPEYTLGDSLYGYVDFKSVEINPLGQRLEYSGKGYFRTLVTNNQK